MRPMTKATRGVLKAATSKKALILAVAGVMYFYKSDSISLSLPIDECIVDNSGKRIEFIRRIQIEDSEIVEIVKMTLKIATI